MLSVSACVCKLQIWWTTPPTHTHIFTVFHCPVDVLHYKTLCKPPLSCFQNLFMLTDALCGHLAGVSKMFKSQIEGGIWGGGGRERERNITKHHCLVMSGSLPPPIWRRAVDNLIQEPSPLPSTGDATPYLTKYFWGRATRAWYFRIVPGMILCSQVNHLMYENKGFKKIPPKSPEMFKSKLSQALDIIMSNNSFVFKSAMLKF